MTAREFAEWLAYYQIHPFGPERDDQRIGTLVSALVNVHRKKGSKALTWRNVFPPYTDRKPTRTWQDLLGKTAAIVAAFGGDDRRK